MTIPEYDSDSTTTGGKPSGKAGLAGATGSVYRFSTFQELVDEVPGDRIRDCMEELGKILGTAKLTTELTYAVASNLAKEKGKELPSTPKQVIKLPPYFDWHDDGQRHLEARLHDESGKPLMSVKITPNAADQPQPPNNPKSKP